MPLTVPNTEQMISRRIGPLMTGAGLDPTPTSDGTNPDMAMPIAIAAIEMGQTVADVTHPVNADLAGITNTKIPEYLLRACYQVMSTVLTRSSTDVDFQQETWSEKRSQRIGVIIKAMEAMKAEIDDMAEEAAEISSSYPRIGEIKAGTCDFRVPGGWPFP